VWRGQLGAVFDSRGRMARGRSQPTSDTELLSGLAPFRCFSCSARLPEIGVKIGVFPNAGTASGPNSGEMATIPASARGPGQLASGQPLASQDSRRSGGASCLSDRDKAMIRAAVLALPPATDEQIEALCEVIVNARTRQAHAAPDHAASFVPSQSKRSTE
jgi:hypothetical protein